NLVRAQRIELGEMQIQKKIENCNPEKITLQFVSPTKLIFQERDVYEPEFHHIFKRLRDRISSLLHFYCGFVTIEEHRELFKLLGDLSEKVEVTARSLDRMDNFRLTRRKEHHPLSGFTGTISFSGDLRPFLPFLIAGEWIGVGKNTVFGNGWYEIVPPSA
ncbi:CRISPR system precrRNA processing endoribonuclease RAMP protein Cas6, partial [bacterium]|nr:CRISPR system precrRNA processing endoribonuclease RAMP protein Cas6 [bacterium]